MRKIELNKEELTLGLVAGTAFVGFLGWWVLLTGPLCAFLWALSGAHGFSKVWRRIGVALVLSIALLRGWEWCFSFLTAFGVLSLGYGIPTFPDRGSALGRFFTRFFSDVLANDFVRGTIAALLWLAFLPLAFVNPMAYIVSGAILIVLQVVAVIYVEGTVEILWPF